MNDYPSHSRIHPLRSFPSHCYVKRDDELGFGVTGSKIRKYRSLIPFFLSQHIQQVIVIGSSHSNHVLSITQLLIENGIEPLLFLKGNPLTSYPKGNFLFTNLFVPEIHWIDGDEWNEVERKAEIFAENATKKTFVLPEGACHPEALPGLLSLPQDILRNEQEMGIEFDHLFIEAGTGLTAIAAILWFQLIAKKITVHVVRLAGTEQEFLSRLLFFHGHFEKQMGVSVPFPTSFKLYHSRHAASFGSTNRAIFKEIQHLARQEGFLTDPIYSAKLFLEARHVIQEKDLKGNILLLHAGGGLTLAGFQDQLIHSLT